MVDKGWWTPISALLSPSAPCPSTGQLEPDPNPAQDYYIFVIISFILSTGTAMCSSRVWGGFGEISAAAGGL